MDEDETCGRSTGDIPGEGPDPLLDVAGESAGRSRSPCWTLTVEVVGTDCSDVLLRDALPRKTRDRKEDGVDAAGALAGGS